MTLNLLLFAITLTIFLEIEFDFIFYVQYRSEEISPLTLCAKYLVLDATHHCLRTDMSPKSSCLHTENYFHLCSPAPFCQYLKEERVQLSRSVLEFHRKLSSSTKLKMVVMNKILCNLYF